MTIREFDSFIRRNISFKPFTTMDSAINGLQVGKFDKEIKTISFALDASLDAIDQAIEFKSDMLFVHHGIFWGGQMPLTNNTYDKIEKLAKHGIALYAVHLPLDADSSLGLNVHIAKRINLTSRESFDAVGIKGLLSEQNINKLAVLAFNNSPCTIWDFNSRMQTCAIITGGASKMVNAVLNHGIDCFITGDATHEMYHFCKENKISVIAGGHYASEFIGFKYFADFIAKKFTELTVNIIDQDTGK